MDKVYIVKEQAGIPVEKIEITQDELYVLAWETFDNWNTRAKARAESWSDSQDGSYGLACAMYEKHKKALESLVEKARKLKG